MEQGEKFRSIPSLDGVRALSVFSVILGHLRYKWLDRIPFNVSFRNGNQGVAVFFGISGLLITHLLLKELRHHGNISLRRFYLRRTMRIFPPFYVFLLAMGILSVLHQVHVSAGDMLAAATYTWNYVSFEGKGSRWILAHCWSLSLEEQFYLLWPLSMKFFSRWTNLWIAAGVIFLSPISRVLTYLLWPQMRSNLSMMLHTRLDAIMIGCLLALIIDIDIWQRFRRLALHWAVPAIALSFLFLIDTPAEQRWAGKYLLTVGFPLQDLAIAMLLLYVVFRHESILGKLLNLKLLRHLGIISYSLYLWQQPFAASYTRPLSFLWIILCAEMSFFLVERPCFRFRDRLERKLFPIAVEKVGNPTAA